MGALVLCWCLTIVFFVGSIVFLGSGFGLFFVPSALIVLVVFPLLIQYVLYNSFIGKAFTIPLGKNPSKQELEKSNAFFKSYAKTIWVTAIIVVAIYLIACMTTLENAKDIGPMMQFIIATIIYAGLLNLLVVIPYESIISKTLSNEN